MLYCSGIFNLQICIYYLRIILFIPSVDASRLGMNKTANYPISILFLRDIHKKSPFDFTLFVRKSFCF